MLWMKIAAQRKDNGKWVIGDLIRNGNRDYKIMEVHSIYKDGSITKEEIPVDETTVCFWTGLNDCYGNMIWENSIVENVKTEKKGIVSWIHGKAGFGIDYYVEDKEGYDSIRPNELKVIGNIFIKP